MFKQPSLLFFSLLVGKFLMLCRCLLSLWRRKSRVTCRWILNLLYLLSKISEKLVLAGLVAACRRSELVLECSCRDVTAWIGIRDGCFTGCAAQAVAYGQRNVGKGVLARDRHQGHRLRTIGTWMCGTDLRRGVQGCTRLFFSRRLSAGSPLRCRRLPDPCPAVSPEFSAVCAAWYPSAAPGCP